MFGCAFVESPGRRPSVHDPAAGLFRSISMSWSLCLPGPSVIGPTPASTEADHVCSLPSSLSAIGLASHPGRPIRLGQRVDDALRHLHVLGPTGVGKSTLLLNLIMQDLSEGNPIVVVDPKGDLVDDVLARTTDQISKRVVVLDAARRDFIVGFNPLAVGEGETELTVDGILHVFHRLHSDSWGPRTQDILHNSLLILAGSPHASICLIPQLLVDARFRRGVLTKAENIEAVRVFWSWYDGLSSAERNSVISPLMNKLRPFLLRTSLRTLLGQASPSFDPKSVLDGETALLVPLRKGLIGAEAANLLGSLVVARIWQLAQARSSLRAEKRRPVFLYLDEFQDYLHLPTDIAEVLAQSRGLGMGMILAHQHLGQLGPAVRSATLSNAQSQILFRLAADDAATIARSTGELDQTDFTSLRRFEVYARLLDEGSMPPFASARTQPPPPAIRNPEDLGTVLARRWGRSPTEVDDSLKPVKSEDLDSSGEIGRRKRGSS